VFHFLTFSVASPLIITNFHTTSLSCVRFSIHCFYSFLERKRPLGRPRPRWEGWEASIKEAGCDKKWAGFIWLRIGTNGGLL
jgi:hypothetical protein